MKFKILPKVHGFRDAKGIHHLPGDIVDLPESYKGESWLEPVLPPKKVKVPPAKVEPAAETSGVAVPLEEPKAKGKKSRKMK